MASSEQEAFAKRKRWLWEAALRRKVLKGPGGDDLWSKDEKDRRSDLKTNTICEARNYREPDAFPSLDDLLKDQSPYPAPSEDGDYWQGVARLEIVRVDPDREKRLFPPGFECNAYWQKLIQHSLDHLDLQWDTADFHANYLLRILYLYGDTPDHFGDPPWRQPPEESSSSLADRVPVPKSDDELEQEKRARLARNPNFSGLAASRIQEMLIGFKYWMDDPFWAEPVLDYALPWHDVPVVPGFVSIPTAAGVSNSALVERRKAKDIEQKREQGKDKDVQDLQDTDPYRDDTWWYDMTYWSENHQVLFATAEYLAGQMWPTATFRAGAQHRDLGPDSPRDGDKTGEERMAHAKPRLLRWLADRLRFGFSEWVSAGYYKEDFDALFNLADFCLDDEIRTRACMVIDLMLFELARFTQNGELGSTSGRVYADQKQCGWEQSIGGMLQLLFAAHGTVWVGMDSCESALASSRQYVPPDAILAIGQDTPDVFVDRSRVSVTFDEAPGYGVGTTSDEDVLFWWGKGAYVNKQIVEASHRVAKQYKLMHTDPFKQAFLPADIGSGLVSAADCSPTRSARSSRSRSLP